VTWKKNKRYETLDSVWKELSVDGGSKVEEFHVNDSSALDLQVPPDSPSITMNCYPRGPVPGVRSGTSSGRDK
jgi:hypothetical protein